jgi:SWI/SNF-related matrix-associated actin-dependent regulator 1 of chromatin subfamily A
MQQNKMSGPLRAQREDSEEIQQKNISPEAMLRAGQTFWPEGLTPMPHQLEAVNWAFSRKNSYLALDPGLGKTIVAALLANVTGAHIFYVCPPFLTQNTTSEFEKWTFQKKLYLLPDSMLTKKETLDKLKQATSGVKNKVLIIDEAHRFKNERAQRSKALYVDIMKLFRNDRIVFMSGTPMPNSRPIELWPVIQNAAAQVFGLNFFSYGLKFCGGYKDQWGWKFDGFTNKPEFKSKIFKSFMLRQKKELLNLPPKLEGLLTVGDNIPAIVSKVEKKILEHYSPEDLVEGRIKQMTGEHDLHIARYLRLLGEYKLKYVLPYIDSLLEETKENLLIFAVHKDTVHGLAEHLKDFKPLVITGDVHKDKRQALVQEFQTSKDRRVFIGNIQACGVGFTLTKATRVLFVEFSWVDGENQQASDRAHRIGQKDTVLVQYVVLKDSFDRTRMEVLLKKRGNAI